MKSKPKGNWQEYVRLRVLGQSKTSAYRSAGYTDGPGARGSAYRLEQKDFVQKYMAELRDKAEVHPINILRTLNRQMTGDISDFMDEKGRWDLTFAREVGITDLIERIIVDARGNITHLRLYSSQKAAQTLADVCGLKQMPKMNEEDTARMREHIEAEVNRLMLKYEWDREKALEFVREAFPKASKYLM